MFCMIDRKSFDDGLYLGFDRESFDFLSREELGRFTISMTPKEYLDFVELNLADWWAKWCYISSVYLFWMDYIASRCPLLFDSII